MSTMSTRSRAAQKILRRVKGLGEVLQISEEPLLAIPAIWDNGKADHSTPCEVIVTNQRLIGYYCVTFPRKRGFLAEVQLASITAVTLRHKAFEPLVRELLVREGSRKLYIRATRRYIEELYAALRSASEHYVVGTPVSFTDEEAQQETGAAPTAIYGRQEICSSFASSPLAITLLLAGGLLLEVLGFVLWTATQSLQAGLPLFIAGLVAVLTAIFIKSGRQR